MTSGAVLGCQLERFIPQFEQPAATMADDSTETAMDDQAEFKADDHAETNKPKKNKSGVKRWLLAAVSARLLQYYLACRSLFLGAPFIGMAVDGSRISGRNTMIGMLALPVGFGVWPAPQVHGGEGGVATALQAGSTR